MTVRALVGAIRFIAAAAADVHRACRIYFAEEIDRAAAAKERNR